MAEFAANFHFLRPWALLLLALPLFFYWRYFRGIKNKSSWEGVVDRNLLGFLLIKGSSKQRKALVYLAYAGIIGAVLALAGPSWKKKEVPSLAPENPVMLLLNLSTDMAGKDITPNRLSRAKFEISDLLSQLRNVQTGLIVYSDEPYLISPITDDARLIGNLLPAVDFEIMPSNGDRLDRALALAVEKFRNAGYPDGNIVIFSSDVGQRFDLALEEAEKAAAAGYRVSVVDVASAANEKLRLISQKGRGVYALISPDDTDVRQIAERIAADVSDELKISENLRSTWEDYGYYLVIIPLLCCLYFFRRGIAVVVLLAAGASQAQAGFFLNNNQEGLRAFNSGDYAAASEKFENPQWKGAAYYRRGEYEQAYREYARGKGAEALYNQGNALAKSGKIEEAVGKYEEVLKLAPDHEDAKFNLEYLKQKQEEQQQQQNQQGGGQDKQEQDKQDNRDGGQNERNQRNEQSENGGEQNSQNNSGDNNAQNNGDSLKNQENAGQDERQEQSKGSGGASAGEEQKPQEQQGQGSGTDGGEEKRPDGRTAGGAGEPEPRDGEERQEQPQAGAAAVQKGDDKQKYDEQVQARELQYREIPEDPGGLLRAFIAKEHAKNRYKD